jgi:hypothetical protein
MPADLFALVRECLHPNCCAYDLTRRDRQTILRCVGTLPAGSVKSRLTTRTTAFAIIAAYWDMTEGKLPDLLQLESFGVPLDLVADLAIALVAAQQARLPLATRIHHHQAALSATWGNN